MSYGRVYVWTPNPNSAYDGCVTVTVVPLVRLDTHEEGSARLWGRHVRVRNGGGGNELELATGAARPGPNRGAQPNPEGGFPFEPGGRDGRPDKGAHARPAL